MLYALGFKLKHYSMEKVLRTVLRNFSDEMYLKELVLNSRVLVSKIDEPDHTSILFADKGIQVVLKTLDKAFTVEVTYVKHYVRIDGKECTAGYVQSIISRAFTIIKLSGGTTNEKFLFKNLGIDCSDDSLPVYG